MTILSLGLGALTNPDSKTSPFCEAYENVTNPEAIIDLGLNGKEHE